MIKAFLRSLLKPFSFVPALLMMYLIFSFSAQDGTTSGNLSYKVSEIIVETANDAFDLHWSSSEIKQHIKEIPQTGPYDRVFPACHLRILSIICVRCPGNLASPPCRHDLCGICCIG